MGKMSRVKAYIIDMTEKAVKLASEVRPKGVWIPKSQLFPLFSQEPLVSQNFLISDWILQKKGAI